MSAFKTMWLMIMFDLPTKTKKDKKRYHWFHDELVKEGYIRIQYSIYAKVFASPESAFFGRQRITKFVKINIKKGNIRMIIFTDKQFANMKVLIGEQSEEEQNAPKQLLLF
jgi:CRISPR-associated protein Cas2